MIAQDRNKDLLKNVIIILSSGKQLEKKYKDHRLRGKFSDCKECHIAPDWLLIYKIENEELHLIRTGSHSELFV